MRRATRTAAWWMTVAAASGGADGVASPYYKSGPVQVAADGRHVWIANEHADSIARIDALDDTLVEFALPEPSRRESPRGLSVSDDGQRVWVAGFDSDRVFVLDGTSGAVLDEIVLPWGSAPYGIALSRPGAGGVQRWAAVTLHRAEAVALIDTQTLAVTVVDALFHTPLGVAWTEEGEVAWVSHLLPDGEHPRLTRIDASGAEPRVTTRIRAFAADPRHSGSLRDADPDRNVAEGGYLNFRGHPAQLPSALAGGLEQLWLPTQYHNMTNDVLTPDSTLQASIRKLDLTDHRVSDDDKVILSARHVHDPLAGGNDPAWLGYGWDAQMSGAVDLTFAGLPAGLYALLVGEQSDDVVVMPWDTGPIRSSFDPNAPGLPEVAVGRRPLGVAVASVVARGYVYNSLSFDVSIVDLSDPAAPFESGRLALAGPTPGSLLSSPTLLRGAELFHTSADPRISANGKVACASCHINAELDGRVWAFEGLPPGTAGQGHGPRKTTTLLGIGQSHVPGQLDPDFGQLGQLHRSGDRDEIQDFEHTFRGPLMGGTGFVVGVVPDELGAPTRGLDADLDALADYLLALPALQRSPARSDDGSLSEAAIRGAVSFLGADVVGKMADADCGGCHVPETAFLDFRYHDVGQRRDGNENELDAPSRPCQWCVNTPSLVGAWASFPLAGLHGFPESFLDMLLDFRDPARPSPHGNMAPLTGRQVLDLAEFVRSIDGQLGAAELRALRDVDPPGIERVSVTSPSRLEVWFDETVEPSSAADPSHYRIVRESDGVELPVLDARWDGQNGDRVQLTVDLAGECDGVDYRLEPSGPILDVADWATGGTANAIDTADPRNVHPFRVSDTFTVSLGASGYENLTVRVHDVSPVGPGLSTWGHDSIQMFDDGNLNPGFLRFEWRGALVQHGGIVSSAALLDASFSLSPAEGDVQAIEVRRTLQSWDDPLTGGDWNNSPTGAPTWRDHAHPSARWNQTGARSLGGTGAVPSDYDGPWDLSASIDAVVTLESINEPVHVSGSGILDAYRYWFDHPANDYGHALRLQNAPPAQGALSFHRGESELSRHAPALTLTYTTAALGLDPLAPGEAGQVNTLRAGGATPGATVTFVLSTATGSTAVPGCGIEVCLGSPIIAGTAVADAAGVATIDRFVPASLSGQTVYVHAVDRNACTVSNRREQLLP